MKNTFTLLAGIVFLLAIPFAGCHHHGHKPERIQPGHMPRNVTIELTEVSEIKGEKHLQMYDSIHMGIDSAFITDVYPGKKVIWSVKGDEIEKIIAIEGRWHHFIFIENPHSTHGPKEFEMDIPEKVERCIMEKYVIMYKLKKDDSTYVSDPYLRVPEN